MATGASAAISASERTGLLNLYTSTNGSTWAVATNWNGPAGTECTWYGIYCDTNQTTVLNIALQINRLTGTLSDLSAFTNLQGIYIYQNDIGGQIPSLSALKNLQNFQAEQNSFTGSLPGVAGLTNLQVFLLSYNNITGTIPPLDGLSSLQVYAVDSNRLSGSIPALTGLGSLTTVDFSFNQLTGTVPSLAGMTGLISFAASSNLLTGSLPALDGLSNLQNFLVSYNQLTGSIPSLAGLSAMQDFEINNNNLNGTVPSLADLTHLQYFSIAYNQLTGPLPPAPTSLVPSQQSTLCPNSLTPNPDAGWDAATLVKPWYLHCNQSLWTVTPDVGPNVTVNPSNPVTVGNGLTATFGIFAAAGYSASVAGNCGPPKAGINSDGAYYTTNPITSNCTVSVTALPAPTLALTSSPSPTIYGQDITLTAVLSGGQSPTGQIMFYDGTPNQSGATLIGTATVSGGQASLTTSTLPAGKHSLYASYGGDVTNYMAVGALKGSQVVVKATTTMAPLQLPENIHLATGITISAPVTVVAPGAGSPTGRVVIEAGSNSCFFQLPATSCVFVLSVPPGTSSLAFTATYDGDNNFSSSSATGVVPEVNSKTTQTIVISSLNPSVYGQGVTFEANVADAWNPSGAVTFFDGSTALGQVALTNSQTLPTASTADFKSFGLGAGSHNISAQFAGDSNNDPSTGALSPPQVVLQASTKTILDAPTMITLGQTITVGVSLDVMAPGAGIPTGSVTISDGTESCRMSLPQTSCTLTISSAGGKTLTGTYSGDTNFVASTASASVTVNTNTPQKSSTTLSASANPSIQNQAVQLQATIAGNAPTGSVTFQDGSTVLCDSVAVRTIGIAKLASCVVTFSNAGSHVLNASYSGDIGNQGSSASLTQSVSTATAFNPNQFGLTGSWYNPDTSGQGLLLEVYPDLVSPGKGVFGGGFFTFGPTTQDGPTWYTVQGTVDGASQTAQLSLFEPSATGTFNAGPPVTAKQIGTVTATFGDCTHMTLTYAFQDGSNRAGTIPLTRLSANTTCGATGDTGGAIGTNYLNSGAWYNVDTGGQGMFFDFSPVQSTFFGAWYTYGSNGLPNWYTIQSNSVSPTQIQISDAPIYISTGGAFNDSTPVKTIPVGVAQVVFKSCSSASVTYTFTSGDQAGQTGVISLVPVGPTSPNCNF